LQGLKHFEEAIVRHERAIAIDPAYAQAFVTASPARFRR